LERSSKLEVWSWSTTAAADTTIATIQITTISTLHQQISSSFIQTTTTAIPAVYTYTCTTYAK